MATANELLRIAARELGTKESPAGSNRVKYNTDYYGSAVSGSAYPWCAVFVWWVCKHAGVYLPVKTASCTVLMAYAKSAGMWVKKNYRPGDLCIYDWNGDGKPDHIGIVYSVSGNTVIAIEGNTAVGNDSNGGQVMRRDRRLSQILGAVRPKYDEEEEMDISKLTDADILKLAERMQSVLAKQEQTGAVADELAEAVNLGITDGSRPKAFVTRAQAAVMAKRAAEKCN